MKNKQKMWRRPDVQKKFREAAIGAAESLAEKAEGKTKRFFMDRVQNLKVMRIGRMVKEHMLNMPSVT